MGRLYAPDLLLTGRTDAVVLLLPGRMLAAPWSGLVSSLVVAGAFAAFLSTSSGLTVSVAGVLSQDLLRGRLRTSVRGFRAGALTTIAGGGSQGWRGALLAQPAAWSMPVGFAVMVAVSLLTRRSVPPSAGRVLARLHAPEALGLEHATRTGR